MSLRTIRSLCVLSCLVATAEARPADSVLPQYRTLLVAGDGAPTEFFGWSVTIDGDTAVVGTKPAVSGPNPPGSAYVFRRVGSVWSEEAKLVAPDGMNKDNFGRQVALSGDTILLAARNDDTTNGINSGSAYVFVRQGSTWSFQAKLTASDGNAGDRFGESIALDGDTALIGADLDEDIAFEGGSAYVFVRQGSTWTEQAKLVRSGGDHHDNQFGACVAVVGDTAIVSAPNHDSVSVREGAAWVFERTGTTWTEMFKLTHAPLAEAEAGDRFGWSLAFDGQRVVVGMEEDGFFSNNAGAAYIFSRQGANWPLERKLRASDTSPNQFFSHSLALSENLLVVGAPGTDHAYVFRRLGVTWTEETLLISNSNWQSAALDGRVALLGETAHGVGNTGAARTLDLIQAAPFCNASDGSLTACPCGNAGQPETGCDLQQGTGGIQLRVVDQRTVVQNRATLSGSGYPVPSTPGVTVIRSSALDASSPVVFGDGLRCIGTPVVRVGATLAALGTSVQTIGHGAGAGTFYYQLWVRNTPVMFCDPTAAFNLSNGRSLIWP